jgi:hypothetical protein
MTGSENYFKYKQIHKKIQGKIDLYLSVGSPYLVYRLKRSKRLIIEISFRMQTPEEFFISFSVYFFCLDAQSYNFMWPHANRNSPPIYHRISGIDRLFYQI